MVKIPTFVVDTWNGAAPGDVLARLDVEERTAAQRALPRMKLRLEKRPEDESIPLEYNVQARSHPAPMMTFSETAAGDSKSSSAYRMHGAISTTADVQPPLGAQYQHLVTQRSLENMVRHRLPDESLADVEEASRPAVAAPEVGKKRKADSEPSRGRGRDLEELKGWLLRTLGTGSFSLDELAEKADESKYSVKAALPSIAQYDRNSNKYTLRDEFRTAQDMRRLAGDGSGAVDAGGAGDPKRVKREQ